MQGGAQGDGAQLPLSGAGLRQRFGKGAPDRLQMNAVPLVDGHLQMVRRLSPNPGFNGRIQLFQTGTGKGAGVKHRFRPGCIDKGGQYFKSQWLNPLGGGLKTPEAANRQSVMAKYGGKFKALAGSSATVKPPVAQKAAAPQAAPKIPTVPKPAPSGPPPVALTQSATMEEAWAALNENNPGKDGAVIEKLWFDTIGKLFPNKSNTDLKVHEWGRLKAEFEKDELPM